MSTQLIYQPAGRAREYAEWALNVYQGCDHGCVYCHGPLVMHKTRPDFLAAKVRPDFLERLKKEAPKFAADHPGAQILLSFACDPYCHLDEQVMHTREAIKILHDVGLYVCTLTKGGMRAVRDFSLFGNGDAFASSLTFTDMSASAKWEPSAATPYDRMQALQIAHALGIPTWVSLEPVIDPAQTLELIRLTHEYVNLYKVGKLNYRAEAASIDWYTFGWQAAELCSALDKQLYIKNDLREAMY